MPVAVELNGLLPGRGPGRGAPGRGPGAPGLGAPGRGAPGPWGLGADGLAPWSWRPAGAAGALPGSTARRAGTRRRGPGLPPARAAEVGRGGRSARRPGHPRGTGAVLGPRFGRPGGRRRRDRRQPPGGRVGCRRGTARGGTVGRGRALRGAVGRPVGRGPGGRRGTGRGGGAVVAATLSRRCRASVGPRPGTARRRALARRGRGARPRPGTLTTLISLGGLICRLGGKCFLEPPDHRRLYRRGRRPYELAHFLELVHDGLALDTELFREFVNPDLRHYAPSRPSPLDPLPGPRPGQSVLRAGLSLW